MADNIELNAGTGGATIATDDDGTAHWQYVKVAFGADNTQTRVTAAAPLPVDGSGVTQPVSGTVTADLGATDNAVLDAIAASVAGTLTVGSHAVTNAGTFAVQVDGSALTALQLIDDVVFADDAAFTLGTSKGVMMMGFAGTQSVDANDAAAIAITTAGAVTIHDGGNTITVDGTITANAGTNLNTSALALEAGNLATIAGAVAGTEMQVDIVSGMVTANLGATDNAVLDAIQAAVEIIDNAISGSEMQVDVVAALPAGTNNIGDVDVLSLPRAASHYRNIDANAEAEIKGSAGTLYWLHAMNLTAAKAYVHLYDATAANVNPGTTVPNYTFPLATQGDTNGAGFVLNFGATGQTFANGITLVVTTTTDGSAGDPGTNGVFINAGYT